MALEQIANILNGLGKDHSPRNCLLDKTCMDVTINKTFSLGEASLTNDQLCFRWFGNEFTAIEEFPDINSINISRCSLSCVNDQGELAYIDKNYASCSNITDPVSPQYCIPLTLSVELPENCSDYLESCKWGSLHHPHLCYEASLSIFCCQSCRLARRTFYKRKVHDLNNGMRELRPYLEVTSDIVPVNQTCYSCGSLHKFSLNCIGWDRSSNVTCLAGGCWTYEKYHHISNAWTHSGRAYYRGCRDLRTRDVRHFKPRQQPTGIWFKVKRIIPAYVYRNTTSSGHLNVGSGITWAKCHYDFCNGYIYGYITLILSIVCSIVVLYTIVLFSTLYWDYGRIPQHRYTPATMVDPPFQHSFNLPLKEKLDSLPELKDTVINRMHNNSICKKNKSTINKFNQFAKDRPRKIPNCIEPKLIEQQTATTTNIAPNTPPVDKDVVYSVPPIHQDNQPIPTSANQVIQLPFLDTFKTPLNQPPPKRHSSFTLPKVEVTKPSNTLTPIQELSMASTLSIKPTTPSPKLIDADSILEQQPTSMKTDMAPVKSSIISPLLDTTTQASTKANKLIPASELSAPKSIPTGPPIKAPISQAYLTAANASPMPYSKSNILNDAFQHPTNVTTTIYSSTVANPLTTLPISTAQPLANTSVTPAIPSVITTSTVSQPKSSTNTDKETQVNEPSSVKTMPKINEPTTKKNKRKIKPTNIIP